MQGLFHDHVKRQLLWKYWDVFFNDVKGNLDATIWITIVILNIKNTRTTCYTHRHSTMQSGRVIVYLDSRHYSLTLIQTSYTLTKSHPISYTSTYSDLLHTTSCLNFLTSVAFAHRLTGKGIKQILLEHIS